MIIRKKMNHSPLTLAGMLEIANDLEKSRLWRDPCAAVFSRVLLLLADKYYLEQELTRLMFRMLYLCRCSDCENLWSDGFLRNFSSFIQEREADWPDYLMTEGAESLFSLKSAAVS